MKEDILWPPVPRSPIMLTYNDRRRLVNDFAGFLSKARKNFGRIYGFRMLQHLQLDSQCISRECTR